MRECFAADGAKAGGAPAPTTDCESVVKRPASAEEGYRK
jgi:hypothetical protein